MSIKVRNEFILLNLFVIVLILAINFLSSNAIRIVLGVPFLIFLPGYSFMAAMFPRKNAMDAVERVALSFGTSIAIVPLIGLLLNYTPWGIRLEPVLYSVSLFILVTSVIAWLRRKKLPEQERLIISFQLKLPDWGSSLQERILSLVLALTIIGAVGILAYVIVTPKTFEKFTEFYLLDAAGQMADYPQKLSPGTAGNVVVRIVNYEQQDVTYRIEIRLSGAIIKEIGPVKLQNKQKWEQKMDFVPASAGDDQEVEFILFKEGDNVPYRSLHLWVNVSNG
ncbi:MAG: hypothetical protein A2Z28_04365 [Chloroflexi bacterium RBG_16_51_9]|nr:MAG: hypothetical protein A2Z28_04365 [Chloroflexi bacterium RBG_16_51_9]